MWGFEPTSGASEPNSPPRCAMETIGFLTNVSEVLKNLVRQRLEPGHRA